MFLINSATFLPSKNVKLIYQTIYDSICQFSMPAHYLSVQKQIILPIANRQMGIFRCFSYEIMFPTLTQLLCENIKRSDLSIYNRSY